MQKATYILLSALFVLIDIGCANIVPLTGGETDRKPPKVLKKNFIDSAVNFTGGKLELVFDEWISVQPNEVEIYPLLKNKLDVKTNKNKLVITLPDSLLEKETTYSINFKNAIKDIHESNVLPQFNIRFSTGNYFDSLRLEGKVINAKTGMPDTAAYIMLYKAQTFLDSDIIKQKPLYVQKVNESGNFQIDFLKPSLFVVLALRDVDKNYLYDPAKEGLGFISKPVNPLDTASILIHSFDAIPQKDSITITKNDRASGIRYYQVNIDTGKMATYDYTKSIIIKLKNKVEQINKTKILLYQDSVLDASGIVSLDSTKTKIYINTTFEQNANYSLVLKEGFTTDTLSKPSVYNFKTKKESDYGILQLKFLQQHKKGTPILQLFKDGSIVATQYMNSDTIYRFSLLLPGNYQAKILYDENGNGVWDTGNYFEKRQAETVVAMPSDIVIKAAWNNEVVWEDSRKRR